MKNNLKHTFYENAIPLEVCSYIKNFFDSNTNLHINKPNNPNVTKINSPWLHLRHILEPILSKYFIPNNGQGGNIYKHSNLYTIHVDSEEPYQMINCLIPVYLTNNVIDQHFIVFDQWVDNGFGQTWYGNRPKSTNETDFDRNKKIWTTPFEDSRVYDKTMYDIDETFYKNYLEFDAHKTEYFKGLTGTAYVFKPGNLILFNSNQLHCTGKLIGPWKMGVLINFEGSLDKLLIKNNNDRSLNVIS